jgi:hypothetical protein
LLSKLEKKNLKQIQDLNQRGGRMLTMVDLLEAGTVDLDLAGFLLYMMQQRASFLTAANPSGTGKTTLMGALLNLLVPGVEIRTQTSAPSSDERVEDNCLLVHEISEAPYYSYLWGKKAQDFFTAGNKAMLASCLHADTIEELTEVLLSPPLEVASEDLLNIDLILFMRKEGLFFNPRRRVFQVYGTMHSEENQLLLFEWNSNGDEFEQEHLTEYIEEFADRKGLSLDQVETEIEECKQFIDYLREEGINTLKEVREQITIELEEKSQF